MQAYPNCKNVATRTHYQVARIYGESCRVSEIEKITGCNRSSLMEWCRAYRTDPSQDLVDKQRGDNHSKLQKLQIEEVQATLHQYTPRERLGEKSSTAHGQLWSVENSALFLREKYGVKYKRRTSYIELLHRCGLSYQKTEKIYKNHSQSKVADFEEELERVQKFLFAEIWLRYTRLYRN